LWARRETACRQQVLTINIFHNRSTIIQISATDPNNSCFYCSRAPVAGAWPMNKRRRPPNNLIIYLRQFALNWSRIASEMLGIQKWLRYINSFELMG
jgi:hypothetical protein